MTSNLLGVEKSRCRVPKLKTWFRNLKLGSCVSWSEREATHWPYQLQNNWIVGVDNWQPAQNFEQTIIQNLHPFSGSNRKTQLWCWLEWKRHGKANGLPLPGNGKRILMTKFAYKRNTNTKPTEVGKFQSHPWWLSKPLHPEEERLRKKNCHFFLLGSFRPTLKASLSPNQCLREPHPCYGKSLHQVCFFLSHGLLYNVWKSSNWA